MRWPCRIRTQNRWRRPHDCPMSLLWKSTSYGTSAGRRRHLLREETRHGQSVSQICPIPRMEIRSRLWHVFRLFLSKTGFRNCPLCGSADVLAEDIILTNWCLKRPAQRLRCQGCGLFMTPGNRELEPPRLDDDALRLLWNTRNSPDDWHAKHDPPPPLPENVVVLTWPGICGSRRNF